MKKCSRCKRELSLKEYSFRNKATGRRNSCCRQCQAKLFRSHYKRNRATYVQRSADRKRLLLERIRVLKQGPCTDCAGRFHPVAMDFDHTGSDKTAGVAHLVGLGSWSAIEREIKKCELVCANCHRVRTYTRARNKSHGTMV